MDDERDDFSAFVVAHEQQLLGAAFLLTGDRGHAEDLLQTALAKTYRHWARVGRSDHPVAYVRRVLVTTHISWRRRLLSTEQVVETIPGVLVDDVQAIHAVEDELRRALLRLPPRMRAVLVLRFYDDLTERETARLLGCAVSTVSTHAARGLAALRELLGGGPASSDDLAVPQRGQP